MRITFLFSICFCLVLSSFSQTKYPVSGKLKSKKTNEVLVGATVFVVRSDSTLAAATVSDNKGVFSVKLSRGEYKLKIDYLGMKTYYEPLRVWRDDYLGTIEMEEGEQTLGGVEIKQKAPLATVQGDTTSYSSKAYKTNQNASAKDLIEKMPGMQNDGGEIKAQGEKVKQVLVDGKSFFGQDPNAALNTLPAEVVDKIQVFDDKSEQSKASGIDDGTRIKTLNIITKINMRNGEFGKVYAGGGTDERYSVGGNINAFKGDRRISLLGQTNNINIQNFSTEDLLGVVGDNSGSGRRKGGKGPGGKRPSFLSGFAAGSSANDFMVTPSGGITKTIAGGINYQDNWGKKVEVSSSYFYNNGDNETTTSTFQSYYLTNGSSDYDELDSTTSNNQNHKFNAKLVYKMGPKASLFYLPSVSLQQNAGNTNILGNTSQEGSIINTLKQVAENDLVAANISNNLMFRLNGEKRGRSLFVQGRWDIANSSGDLLQNYSNTTPDTTEVTNQIGELNNKGNTYTGSIMYSEPIGDKGLGTFISYDVSNETRTDITNTNTNRLGPTTVFDSLLSNSYSNEWWKHTPAIGIRKFNRSGGFVIRLKYEYSELDNNQTIPSNSAVNKSFHRFLPFALYRKRLQNKASWFTMYRTYTSAPQASQLTSVIDNSNVLQQTTGNTDLDLQYGHWIMSKYNSANVSNGTVFYAMVNGGYSNNYIGQSTFTASSDTVINGANLTRGSQLFNPVNLDGQFSANAFVTYGFPFSAIKSNLNFNLSSGISNIPSLINNEVANTFNQNYGLGVVVSSNISENVDFTVSTESNLSTSTNSLDDALNNQYLIQTSRLKYDWIMPLGITFRTQLQHQQYFGLSSSLDNTVLLWTAGIGKQLFKNKRGEIQLSVFDILKQNNNIAQNFYSSYYEETNQNVLTRYAMLSFSYNIRRFKTDDSEPSQSVN